MAKYSKAEIAEARATLRKTLRRGDTIMAICRNWNNRSGSSAWDFFKFDKRGNRFFLTHNMAVLLGERTNSHGEICVPYLNMDPAFHLTYNLGRTLFQSKRKVVCERCKGTGKRLQRELINPEADPSDRRWEDRQVDCYACNGKGKHVRDGGYALKSERL